MTAEDLTADTGAAEVIGPLQQGHLRARPGRIQGGPRAALTGSAAHAPPQAGLNAGDTVSLSDPPIPGNEELVSRTINNCYKHGARVFYSARNRVHASGHASREELKLMLNLVRPKFFMQVHG